MNGIFGVVKVVQTNCFKMIPKHDQTAFSAVRQDKPQANIFEVKKAYRKGQKMQKMIPKRDHISLSCTGYCQDGRKAGRRNVCAENEQEKKTGIGLFSQ